MVGAHEYNHAAGRGSECVLPWKKILRIRCSEVAPEAILGPKLATTLARKSLQQYTISSYHA